MRQSVRVATRCIHRHPMVMLMAIGSLRGKNRKPKDRDGLGGRPDRSTSRDNREALAFPLPKALKAAPAPSCEA